jgi:nucleotide-binding universal stress UspA family protein
MSFSKILVATDFSAPARRATRVAAELARASGARVVLLHVSPRPPGLPASAAPARGESPVEAHARQATLAALHAEARPLVEAGLAVEDRVELWADVAAAIVRAAGAVGADLVVLGTHGRSGLAHLALGSVAEAVVRACPVPVVTCRAAGDERLPEQDQALRDETEG